MLRARIKNSIRSYPLKPSGGAFSFGNALQFDGVNDFVEFSPIQLDNRNFFVSFWYNKPNTAKISLCTNSGNDLFCYHFAGGSKFAVYFSLGYSYFGLKTGSDYNTWHHILFGWQNGNLEGYYDGVFLNSYSISNTSASNKVNRLSGYNNSVNFIYDGKINECFIGSGGSYNLAQLATLFYNGGNGVLGTQIETPTAYWRFNEADGATTLTDETGNYNGTLYNFSTPPPYFIPH